MIGYVFLLDLMDIFFIYFYDSGARKSSAITNFAVLNFVSEYNLLSTYNTDFFHDLNMNKTQIQSKLCSLFKR